MFKQIIDIDCLVDVGKRCIYIDDESLSLSSSPNVDRDISSIIGDYYKIIYHDNQHHRDMLMGRKHENVIIKIYYDDMNDIAHISIHGRYIGSIDAIEHFSVYPDDVMIRNYKIVNHSIHEYCRYVRFTFHDYLVSIELPVRSRV